MKILKTLNITALATLFALSAQAEWVVDYENGDYLTSDFVIETSTDFSTPMLDSSGTHSIDGNGYDVTSVLQDDSTYTYRLFTTNSWNTNYTISNVGDTNFDYESYIDSDTGLVTFDTADATGFNSFNTNSSLIESNGCAILTVDNVVFSNNSQVSWNTILYLKQGNYYAINDSVFIGNSNTQGGGAVTIAKITYDASITNTTFVGNYTTYNSGTGGAIKYVTLEKNNSAALNINATTDIYNVGNYAKNGGYLYINAGDSDTSNFSATVNFNIGTDVIATNYTGAATTDDYVFMTLGNGYSSTTYQYDSISSNIANNVLINKTGNGSLIVNSTMSTYYGALDVQEGKMYLNGQLGSSDITFDTQAVSTTETSDPTYETIEYDYDTLGAYEAESVTTTDTVYNEDGSTTITTTVVDTEQSTSNYYLLETTTATSVTYDLGTLNLDAVTIAEGATFAVSLTDDALFTASDSTITINNSGTLIFTASKEMTSSVATALASSGLSITGEGIVKTYGGTLDTTDYTFTKSAITSVSGDTIVSSYGIVSAGDNQVLFSSLSNDITISDVVLGSDSSGGIEATIQIQLADGIVLAETDSAIISFYVGDMAKDISDFNIYVLEDDIWVLQESGSFDYLQYDGDDLMFSVDGDDITATWGYSYGIVVPEPSTYAMIFGGLALGLAMYRRRK